MVLVFLVIKLKRQFSSFDKKNTLWLKLAIGLIVQMNDISDVSSNNHDIGMV